METQEQLELFKKEETVLESIHREVKQQLRKCLDNEEMKEIEVGQNMGIYNFFR